MMKYRLYTPGPTSVPEATLAELNRPVTHHRTSEFRTMFAEVQKLLQYVIQTEQPVHTITGSGTAAFEAGFCSVLKPGSRVLNISNGKFAERWGKYASTFGMEKRELKLEYGQPATADLVAAELKKGAVDAVVLVHSETSTATVCDLEAIAKVVRASGDTLLIVDGITSIGAMPFRMDQWGVDVAITGSQKALMLPPGLGYVALSPRAQAACAANTAARNFYLDLKAYQKSLADSDTPYTPANTLIQAQAVSLRMIKQEGIENVWKRTHTVAEAFRQACRALGLELFSARPADSVTAVRYPAGIADKDFRNLLKSRHNLHIAGGQGSMEGSLFRVNHMGYTDAYDLLAVVAGIEHALCSLGRAVELGSGITAAQRVLAALFQKG